MAVQSEELQNGERVQARRSPHTRYLFGGYLGAEAAGFLVWLAVWCLDGWFTIQFVALFGGPLWLGVATHFVITLIQRFAYLGQRFGSYLLTFVFGGVNVFSSAWGLQAFFHSYGAPMGYASMTAAVLYTLIALLIAIGPERLGIGHLFALWRVITKG